MDGMTFLLVGAIVGLIGAQMLSARTPQVTYIQTGGEDGMRSGTGCFLPFIGVIFVVVLVLLMNGS